MSSSHLLASARSAYRTVLRASASTFSGDPVVREAFRRKVRNDILPYGPHVPSQELEEKVTLVRDMADVLRRNIVQARRVEGVSSEEQERWHVNITDETELGDNETIKMARPDIKRVRRKQGEEVNTDDAPSPDLQSAKPRYYSQLKKMSKERVVPTLNEDDLEESFVRGSGPGGQSVNKTENNVQLLHKPTGIRVSCHETRSLKQNRTIARRNLLDRLDALHNPGLSKQEMQRAKQIERERRRRKKAKKKQKEQQNLDSEP